MNGTVESGSGLRSHDLRNGKRVNLLSAAWAVCFLAATAALTFLELSGAASAAIVAVPLVAGGFALAAYRRFLGEADELLRKIHLEALSFGAGAALAVGTTFMLLVPLGASASNGLAVTLAVLCVGYSYRVIRGLRGLRE